MFFRTFAVPEMAEGIVRRGIFGIFAAAVLGVQNNVFTYGYNDGVCVPDKFDYSLISRIQQANDIVEVVSEHLSLIKKGKDLVGVCPFHDDHRPSMYVNPAKQIFKCFACGAGGDVLKFVQMRENLSFPQALERLAKRCGIELPTRREAVPKSQGQGADPAIITRANEWAMKLWKKNLNDEKIGSFAREYLRKRNITSESVEKWSLCLAADGWSDLVSASKKAKISEKILSEAGLAVVSEDGRCYDKFRNRLMFPIFDAGGAVIAFGGRTLGDDSAKYMNSPATVLFDKSACLYGIDKARHTIASGGTAVIVEGYTDVIMAHQAGVTNVLATLGTSFTSAQARLLRRYAKRIVLVFDSDAAGAAAANRALEVCLAEHIDIKIAFVPEGKDPCDFIQAAGADAFRAVVDHAVDVMEFKWKRLNGVLEGSDNLTDQKAATEEFLTSVALAIKSGRFDPVARGLIITRLSKIIGLSAAQINRQIERLLRRFDPAAGSSAGADSRIAGFDFGTGLYAKAQQEIIEVLLNCPGCLDTVRENLTLDDFDVPVLSRIAEVLFDVLPGNRQAGETELIGRLESAPDASALLELKSRGEKKASYAERLCEAIDIVKKHKIDGRKHSIKAVLNDDDTESLKKITDMLLSRNGTDKRNPGMTAV